MNLLAAILTSAVITVCPADTSTGQSSLRQKVGMLFCIRPEALVDSLTAEQVKHAEMSPTLELTSQMRKTYASYPAGGFCLFAHNLVSPDQVRNLTKALHSLPGRPFIAIDEEGGRVSRLSNNPDFHLRNFGAAEKMTRTGSEKEKRWSLKRASRAGRYVGGYLRRYGFDLDFAPVADVNTNPENRVIGERAFGCEPEMAGKMAVSWLQGLESKGVQGCLKHFPGHGDTRSDTHLGSAGSGKTIGELERCELIPFKEGIREGAGMVMVAHIELPAVVRDSIPATLSPEIINGLLRGKMGFKGVVITDAMEMGAIIQRFGVEQAAIKAILAGVDIILMPYGYKEAFDAVVKAVESGVIPESRIDESISRITAWAQTHPKTAGR